MGITVEHGYFTDLDEARREIEAEGHFLQEVDAQASGGTPIHWHDIGIHFYVSEGVFRFQDPATGAVHECGPGSKFVIPERTLHIEEDHDGYKGVVGLTKEVFPEPFIRPPEELEALAQEA